MGADADDRVRLARAVRTTAEAADLYRKWAADYDADVFVVGVTGTGRIAELLAAHLPDRSQPIVDLGCGTGAAGVRLSELGFGPVDGVDLSPEMLQVAATKGAYRSLIAGDLTAGVPVRDRTYGAAISAGTFRDGHVGTAAVPAILRALRPGAVIAWTIADWVPFAPLAQRWDVLHLAQEPFRRGGAAEMTMLVARLPA